MNVTVLPIEEAGLDALKSRLKTTPDLKLVVYHGITEPAHWFGYEPGHRLKKVFDYCRLGDVDDHALCEEAWKLFNADIEDLAPGFEQYTAKSYRYLRLRSLSMGDVICIEGPDRGPAWWACAVVGWSQVEAPLEDALS